MERLAIPFLVGIVEERIVSDESSLFASLMANKTSVFNFAKDSGVRMVRSVSPEISSNAVRSLSFPLENFCNNKSASVLADFFCSEVNGKRVFSVAPLPPDCGRA